jgi:hypothetical protein
MDGQQSLRDAQKITLQRHAMTQWPGDITMLTRLHRQCHEFEAHCTYPRLPVLAWFHVSSCSSSICATSSHWGSTTWVASCSLQNEMQYGRYTRVRATIST